MAERLADGEAFFVIPSGVMRELDGLKKNPDKGKKALEATRQINKLISMGREKIVKGNGSVKGFLPCPVDEEVISVAKEWKAKGKTYLLTTDQAMMAVAKNEGIPIRYLTNKAIDTKDCQKKTGSLKKTVLTFLLCFVGFIIITVFINYGIEGLKCIFYAFLIILGAILLLKLLR